MIHIERVSYTTSSHKIRNRETSTRQLAVRQDQDETLMVEREEREKVIVVV